MSLQAESTREERAIARRTSGRRDMATLKPEGNSLTQTTTPQS